MAARPYRYQPNPHGFSTGPKPNEGRGVDSADFGLGRKRILSSKVSSEWLIVIMSYGTVESHLRPARLRLSSRASSCPSLPLPTETPNADALDPATTIIDARGCLTPIELGAYQLMWSLIDRIRGSITPLAFCFCCTECTRPLNALQTILVQSGIF